MAKTNDDNRSPGAVDIKLGQRVRTRRLQLHMSQERLAELLGVTFQQVQKYEKGVNRIAASRLHDIAISLEMPIAGFFEELPRSRKGGAPALSTVADALSTPGAIELVQIYAAIRSPKLRRRIVELVRAMDTSQD